MHIEGKVYSDNNYEQTYCSRKNEYTFVMKRFCKGIPFVFFQLILQVIKTSKDIAACTSHFITIEHVSNPLHNFTQIRPTIAKEFIQTTKP
jgi:fumarate reductase subunit C